jgi:hypothetical protein
VLVQLVVPDLARAESMISRASSIAASAFVMRSPSFSMSAA